MARSHSFLACQDYRSEEDELAREALCWEDEQDWKRGHLKCNFWSRPIYGSVVYQCTCTLLSVSHLFSPRVYQIALNVIS